MRQRYDEIQALGAEVVAIGFAAPERLRRLADDVGIPFPMLRDPEYQAYQAFGLKQGTLREIYGLRTAWAYVKLIVRKRRFTRTQSDRLQLGGDFVIDGQGIVRLAYRGRGPADRPPVSRLLDALREAGDTPAP